MFCKFLIRWLTRTIGFAACFLPLVGLNSGEAKLWKQELSAQRPYQKSLRIRELRNAKFQESVWDYFIPAWSTGYETRLRDLRFVSTDPDGKLEAEFRIPSEEKERVLFWAAIYSKYSSRMKVIHDRENPGLVYGYLDFTNLYRTESARANRLSTSIEKRVIENLEHALWEVAQSPTYPSTVLTAENQMGLRQLIARQNSRHRNQFELAAGLRTQTGQRDLFQHALERSQFILPHIEAVFARQGLPLGLARIPFVESSFDNRARSRMGAVGIWQFIPRTSREMIHRRDKKRWSDPFVQTTAAARLLKRYRSVLPDWGSAVTSYNSGIGRITRILKARQGTSVADLKETRGSETNLGFAGTNYHSELLAANLVESYKTQLFSPGTIPMNVAALRAQLSSYPGGACFSPLPVPEHRPHRPNSETLGQVVAFTADVADSGREVGHWIHTAIGQVTNRVFAATSAFEN